MSKTDLTPLSITPAALQRVIQHARSEKNHPDGIREACGFIVGTGGVASRVVPIANIAVSPDCKYAMDPAQVLAAMAEFDEFGATEEVLCVYHSHPKSAAIPSDDDMDTPDHGPAYLIISLERDEKVACRAWRIGLEYVGVPRVDEVLIHVSEDGEPFTAKPPLLPWALTVGNKVQLTYPRPGHANRRTITAEITGTRDDTEKLSITLNPRMGTDPRSMLIDRIKAVRVLRESPAAGRIRQRGAGYAAALAHHLRAGGQTETVARYSAWLVQAYPTWFAHVEGE